MDRSIKELENELEKIIKEKVSNLPKERGDVLIPLFNKQTRLLPVGNVKQNVKYVKQMLSTDDLYSEMLLGKRPIQIAREYNISRSAVSQRLKKLKSKNLVEKRGNKWNVKQNVKHLALSTIPSKKVYEFQTIQIIIPLKNPGQLDILKWDKYIPEMKQWFKRYPYLKFTLNKTTKSVRLFLRKRWIERPEQIKQICRSYVNIVSNQLKKYDIELLKKESRTTGLHLWKRDQIITDGYEKEDGFIGVYHNVDADKILPKDRVVERKTWCDSTPSPDGIESNDPGYFIDKGTMECLIGQPVLDKKLDDSKVELPEYMKKATTFVKSMDTLSDAIHLDIYNKQMHKGLLGKMNDTLELIQKNLVGSSIGKVDINNIKEHDQLICTRCGKVSYAKAIVNKGFSCPHCYFNLRLVYPYLVQNKYKFKPNI